MQKKEFIDQFAVNFISAWCAVNYSDACVTNVKVLENPPVEDALYLAQRAWEKWEEHRDHYI